MESLDSIVRYPMNSESWVLTTIIGGLLVFFGFLLIPLLVVYGYLIQVIKTTQADASEPPVFDDWGRLLADGLKAWVIGIVYMLVPLAILGMTFGAAIVTFTVDGNAGLTTGAMFLGLGLSAVLALVFGYVAAAGIVNFAHKDQFRAAFDVSMLRRVVLHREYVVAWLASIVVMVVAGLVGSLPFVGWILAPFATFYAMSIAARLWSSGVTAALESTERPERASGEQPAA